MRLHLRHGAYWSDSLRSRHCTMTALHGHRNGTEKRHSRGVRRGESRIPFAFERAAQDQVLQLRSVQQGDKHRKVDAPGG